MTVRRWEAGVVGACGILIAFLTFLPAGDYRVAQKTEQITFDHMWWFRWIIVLLALATGAVGVWEIWFRERRSRSASLGFGLLLSGTLAWILSVEGVLRLFPEDLLPTTVRRFTFNVTVGVGPWVAAFAAAIGLVTARGRLAPVVESVADLAAWSRGLFSLRLACIAALITGTALIGIGRTEGIAVIDYPGGQITVAPWALPWIGPGSLGLVVVIGICASAAIANVRVIDAGTIGAMMAWIAAGFSGVAVATSRLISDDRLIEYVADRLGRDEVRGAISVTSTNGPTLAFIGACLVGGAFATTMIAEDEFR